MCDRSDYSNIIEAVVTNTKKLLSPNISAELFK